MVLVEPENPDNIGAAARAMKNMGFQDLRLVNPPLGWKIKGRKMAMKARDTLESSRVFKSVKEAVRDARLVIGTTRRAGPKRGLFIPFQTALQKITASPRSSAAIRRLRRLLRGDDCSAAILFGKESKGLSNHDLAMCDWVTTLPSHPGYPSINLAQAVMIVAFSIFTHRRLPQEISRGLLYVSKEEMNSVLDRFREALSALNYESEGRDVHERIVATLHRLFKRGGLLTSEARMLKGLSRRICERYNTRHG